VAPKLTGIDERQKETKRNEGTTNTLFPLPVLHLDVDDIEIVSPGLMTTIVEYLRDYKIPDGKPANRFAFNAKAKDHTYAVEVVQEAHQHWRDLLSGFMANRNFDL
jgi:hypothetical protein